MCRMSITLPSAQWYLISSHLGHEIQMGRNRLMPLSVEAERCSTFWETETQVFHKPHEQGSRNCFREYVRKVHRRVNLAYADSARRHVLLDS